MADGQDDFQLHVLGLGGQVVKLGLAGGQQNGLVEFEEGISGQLDLFGDRSNASGSGGLGASSRGGTDDALVSRDDILVALAANRNLTGHGVCSGGGGPVASAPAQVETATGDDVAAIDHVRHFAFRINDDVFGEAGGGGQAESGKCGGHQQLFFGLFDHRFPRRKAKG